MKKLLYPRRGTNVQKQRINAWLKISECLPERAVRYIYYHARRKYGSANRGKWTSDEKDLLRRLVNSEGLSWAKIATKMNRTDQSVRDMWRILDTQESQKRGPFTPEEDAKLIKLVTKLQSKTKTLNWNSISNQLIGRSRLQCMLRWAHHLNPSSEGRHEWTDVDDCTLLNEIINSGACTQADINWNKIAEPFNWSRFQVYERFKRLQKNFLSEKFHNKQSPPFYELLDQMLEYSSNESKVLLETPRAVGELVKVTKKTARLEEKKNRKSILTNINETEDTVPKILVEEIEEYGESEIVEKEKSDLEENTEDVDDDAEESDVENDKSDIDENTNDVDDDTEDVDDDAEESDVENNESDNDVSE